MKRRFDRIFPWGFLLLDFFASVVVLLIIDWYSSFFVKPFITDTLSIFLLSGTWFSIGLIRKDYNIGRTDEYVKTLVTLSISVCWFLGLITLLWLPSRDIFEKLLSLLLIASGMLVLMGSFRVGIHMLLRSYRIQGKNYRNAIILGKGGSSLKLSEIFQVRKDFGINFLGYFDDFSPCDQTKGNISDFFLQAPSLDLDLIYINEKLDSRLVKKILDFADENYIKVKMIPGTSLQLEKNLSFSRYGELFVINVNEIPLDNILNSFAKRTFDIVFSSLVIVFILSWLVPLVGILIKLESKGPVFFVQKRNGVNNRVFNCLKFRSMTPNDYADTVQAVKGDTRVTKIGAFLRTSSLDEMPQFFNVLKGDMSVVGPRPHTIPMNQRFSTQIEKYNSRHKIRPGITGLAQIRGYRGEIENPHQIRSRVRLDYFYINNWTFFLDMGIMLKTVYELLYNRENAY